MLRKIINKIIELRDKKIRKYHSYDKSITEIMALSRNDSYRYFHEMFHHSCPDWIISHRAYFSIKRRSFGEDAFHAMWLTLFNQYKPTRILEIGVYRGSTLSLFSLISRELKIKAEIHGISPFNNLGDSVSSYMDDLDYKKDVIDNFRYFKLEMPNLHTGLSNDCEMVKLMQSKNWDLIFIDGNHDEEVVEMDLKNALDSIADDGIIVLDDSALFTDYKKLPYSTVGHPGPSKIANTYIQNGLIVEVLSCGHNRVFRKANRNLK